MVCEPIGYPLSSQSGNVRSFGHAIPLEEDHQVSVDRTRSIPYSACMMRSLPHLLGILLAALLVTTAGLHPAAMVQGVSHGQVLSNQHHGCATTTCPKTADVFGLIVPVPSFDPQGSGWLPPSPSFSSSCILPVPHVGRAPPPGRA